MTCIVGIVDKENNKVYIGGDSAGISDLTINIRKDRKVFKVGDFVIGCTSSYRMIQLLMFSFKPPGINNKNLFEYMCVDFVNAVKETFRDGGFMQTEQLGDDSGGEFLVGYKNRLFKICSDFQVGENLNGIDSIGCGAYFALGSLYFSSKQSLLSVKMQVKSALEASSFYSAGVDKPFIILETSN